MKRGIVEVQLISVILLLCETLAALVSPASAWSAGSRSHGLLDPSTSLPQGRPALVLRASAVRDTIAAPDSVQIEYFVRNEGTLVSFLNDPEFYTFEVLDPNGRPLNSTRPNYEPPNLGDLVVVHLPRGGITGQRVNLACVRMSFVHDARFPRGCDWQFHFEQAGLYRIVVGYRSPTMREAILSDTVRIIYSTPR